MELPESIVLSTSILAVSAPIIIALIKKIPFRNRPSKVEEDIKELLKQLVENSSQDLMNSEIIRDKVIGTHNKLDIVHTKVEHIDTVISMRR